MQLQDWEDVKDYFEDENFFHTQEATFNEKGEILVEVPLNKLGKAKKYFLINGAIEIPAEEGKKAQGLYVEMADRSFVYMADATAEALKNTPAPLIVDRVDINTGEKQENRTCVCKDYDLIWGSKVSCEFRKKVIQIAKNLGLPQENNEGANWLMAVMALETGRTFSPTIGTFKSNPDDNRTGGYVGLIQTGKLAAQDLGVKRSDLLKMTAEQQLDYVLKFYQFKRFEGKLRTKTDLYLAVNYPAACGHGTERDYVVYDSSKPAYDDNPMFKRESHEYYIDKKGKKRYYEGKEGKSYVWEFEEAINDFYNEGKQKKTNSFSCSNTPTDVTDFETKKDTWNVLIKETYTGSKCTHIERTAVRSNCRRGTIQVFDHNKNVVLTIDDCLLEGVGGEDRMKTNNDVPFGYYQIDNGTTFYNSTASNKISYGPNPRLVFEPIKGRGDEADRSGRSAIRIHGGRQERVKNPVLKRTQGCIRVYDADAKRLYDWWVDFKKKNPKIKAGYVVITK